MAFWDDVLALSPTVMWMADESSGTSATDDSGNSKTGTYTGSVYTQGETSIISNHPEKACVYLDGTDVYILRADESALDVASNTFTAIVTVKPENLTSQRDIIGKLDCWQIWLETTGRITGYFTPAWTAVTSSNDTAGKLVTTAAALIAIRQDGGASEASVWIGHPGSTMNKVGTATKSNNLANSTGSLRMGGSSTGGGRSFKGWIQGFAYWPSTALSDTTLSSLYTTWDTTPTVTTPDAPSITKPTGGSTFSYGMLVTVTDGADTGQNGTLEYKVEKNVAGAGWTTLIDWTETRPVDYLIDVSAYTEGTTQLRAYMRRDVDHVSDASATVSVTIDHDANSITTPTIVWEWSGTEIVGCYADAYVNGDPTALGLSRWQIGDTTAFADCDTPTGQLGAAMEWTQALGGAKGTRFGFNGVQDTGGGLDADYTLVDDQDYYVRMRYEDELGATSEWSAPVRVKTGVNKSTTTLYLEDQTANDDHGQYVFSDSNVGTPWAFSTQVHNHNFPYHRISGGATEYGDYCDNEEYALNTSAGPFADVAGTCPPWRLRVRGYLMFEAASVGHGLAGLLDDTGASRFFLFRNKADSKVYMAWYQNTGVALSGGYIDTGLTLDAGEEYDIEIEWTGSVITANGSTIYTPGTNPDLYHDISYLIIGHHNRIGPKIGAAYHMMEGVHLEYEFEWDGVLEVNYVFDELQKPDTATVTRTA